MGHDHSVQLTVGQLIQQLAHRLVLGQTFGQAAECWVIGQPLLHLRVGLQLLELAARELDAEEALLYRDMRNDAVSQLVRRLQAAKLQS